MSNFFRNLDLNRDLFYIWTILEFFEIGKYVRNRGFKNSNLKKKDFCWKIFLETKQEADQICLLLNYMVINLRRIQSRRKTRDLNFV